jgi:hypothetical protein
MSTASLGSRLLGLGLSAAFFATLPIAVQTLGTGSDLGIWISNKGPYQAAGVGGTPDPFRIFPSDRAARVRADDPPDVSAPGLWLRTRRMTFGKQWEHEVTVPLYRGPLVPADSPICGYRLALGEEVFQTAAFRELAQQQVNAQWARVREMAGRENVTIGALSRFAFEAKLAAPGLVVDLAAEDENGAGLSARLAFRIQAGGGRLVVTNAAPPRVTVTARLASLARNEGTRRADDAGFLGSFFGDYARGQAEAQLRALAASKAGEMADFAANLATGQFARLAAFPSPLPNRPNDTFSVVIAEQPAIANGRLSVGFCLAARLDPQGTITAGPNEFVYRQVPSPTLPETPAKGPRVELALNGDALNQLLFVAWKTGALRETGGSLLASAKKDKSVDDMLQQLDFDLRQVDPTLPPVVSDGDDDHVAITVAGIRLGTVGKQDGPIKTMDDSVSALVVHAEALGTVAAEGDDVVVRGELKEPHPGSGDFAIHANCVKGVQGVWTLSSCVGDLLPIAKSEWARYRRTHEPPTVRFPIGTLLESLAKGGLFTGLSVKIAHPSIETHGKPLSMVARMDLDVGAATGTNAAAIPGLAKGVALPTATGSTTATPAPAATKNEVKQAP